jgi:hypothetical protein
MRYELCLCRHVSFYEHWVGVINYLPFELYIDMNKPVKVLFTTQRLR